MNAAPYASSAQTSISPKRWPPNCALPPSGCWVMSEYGPIDRAWILSSTRCELQHVDVADGHVLLERVAGHPVEQRRLAALRQARAIEPVLDLHLRGAVEDRRREVEAERMRG